MSLKKNLSDDEVRQIAELHYNLLPDSFLASFGRDFLYLIYQKIELSVGSTIIVYCINSEVVGFIAGGKGLKNVYLQLLKNPLQLCKFVLPQLLRKSTVIKLLLLLIRKNGSNNTAFKMTDAELYSICVTKKHQGSAVAEALYVSLCDFFKENNLDSFMIVVGSDLSQAQRFYIKQGAVPVGILKQGSGKQSIVFKQLL